MINPNYLIKLTAAASLFSISMPVFAADAVIALSSDGFSIKKDGLGQLSFAYPKLLGKTSGVHAVSSATVNGDSAELTYTGSAYGHVKILKGQIQFNFTDVPGDVTDTKLESILGFTDLMGSKWAIGAKSGIFPTAQPADPFLFKGDAGNFQITSTTGASISLKFPSAGWQQLQDNRQWSTNAFSWFYKKYFDQEDPQYTILVDDGSSDPVDLTAAAAKNTASGPTPYPSTSDKSAWMGKGPIKTGDWMTDERNAFWNRRNTDQGKIVFVGDSIIGGWKLEKDFPGKPVANRGVGDDVSRGVLFRLQQDVLNLHPKAIVLEIGGNDNSADGKLPDFLFNINAIIDLAQKANPDLPVILCGIPPKGIPASTNPGLVTFLKRVYPEIPSWNAELVQIASTRKNVYYVDCYTPLLLADGSGIDARLFQGDQVHPTDAGHAKLAEPISKVLTELKLF